MFCHSTVVVDIFPTDWPSHHGWVCWHVGLTILHLSCVLLQDLTKFSILFVSSYSVGA